MPRARSTRTTTTARAPRRRTYSRTTYNRPYRRNYSGYRRYTTGPVPSDDRSVGEKIGGFLGGLAQKAIKTITGFGDYTLPHYPINANKLLETNDPPIVKNNGKEFIIRHREYLGDIYSGVAGSAGNAAPSPFRIETYNINPALTRTFPWLANVAARFEQYSVEGMLFEFKSMYSDAAVQIGGSLGSVIMATTYNAAKPAFQSKIEMENYEFAMSAKPSVSMCHPIECEPSQSVLSEQYVRTNDQDINDQDIKMYDFGKFQIASQGIPCTGSAQSLGELWVTYQIKLLKPRISDYLDSGYARIYQPNSIQPSGSNIFDPNWASSWYKERDNIGITLVDNKSFTIPLHSNSRTYMISLSVFDPSGSTSQSAAIGYFTDAGPGTSNCELVELVGMPPIWSTKVIGSVTTSGSSYIVYIRTDPIAPGKTIATISFPGVGLGSGLTFVKSLVINSVPDGDI